MTSADFDPQYGYPRAGSSHGQPGGLGTRFFARLIDGILINIVVFVVSLFLFDRDYWWLVTGLFSGRPDVRVLRSAGSDAGCHAG